MIGGGIRRDYTKIIFVSKENVLLGPMAEWIMKSILMDKSKQIMSRGLVVLFAEPRDQRVTELLMNHGVPCESRYRKNFMQSRLMRQRLCSR